MRFKLILVFSALVINSTIIMAQKTIKQTAGRDQLGEFAPKFAELNDDVLFGEVWSRTDKLGLRDRSLVTITALISQGITDSSLIYHLQSAKQNGITRTEIAEILTHMGSMRVGQRYGRLLDWPRMFGRRMLPEQMRSLLSSVK